MRYPFWLSKGVRELLTPDEIKSWLLKFEPDFTDEMFEDGDRRLPDGSSNVQVVGDGRVCCLPMKVGPDKKNVLVLFTARELAEQGCKSQPATDGQHRNGR